MGALPKQRDGAWNELSGPRALPGWTSHLGYTPGGQGSRPKLLTSVQVQNHDELRDRCHTLGQKSASAVSLVKCG